MSNDALAQFSQGNQQQEVHEIPEKPDRGICKFTTYVLPVAQAQETIVCQSFQTFSGTGDGIELFLMHICDPYLNGRSIAAISDIKMSLGQRLLQLGGVEPCHAADP